MVNFQFIICFDWSKCYTGIVIPDLEYKESIIFWFIIDFEKPSAFIYLFILSHHIITFKIL